MTFLSAYVESMLNQFVNLEWLADKNELEALAKLIPIVSSEELAHFLRSNTRNPPARPYFVPSYGLLMTLQLRSMES